MESIRVLIADDHTLFRDGLRSLLSSIPDIEVVGEASSGKEALRLAVEHQPDVILMDIQMPDLNGIEATRQILRASPHVGVIVLTMFQDDDSVFAVMRAGARGYVLKGADQAVLLRAVRALANGESLFSPEIAQRLIQFFANFGTASPPELFPELTMREREILALIAEGQTNAEIADKLGSVDISVLMPDFGLALTLNPCAEPACGTPSWRGTSKTAFLPFALRDAEGVGICRLKAAWLPPRKGSGDEGKQNALSKCQHSLISKRTPGL